MVEGFGVLCQLPVLHQLVPMQLAPGEDELQLAEWQRTPDDVASLDVDQGFAAGIFRVKMRRVVIAVKHGEIIMITIAAYTFYKITMAIVKAVKQHKNPSPLLKTIRSIGYAEVSASILTLQRSMLVSFGSMDNSQVRFMNAMTGAVVCAFILILGLTMTVKSRRKEHKKWQNQNS